MKKSMTAFAACLIAGMVSAQISSQNVVGYSAVTLTNGYNMVPMNFAVVGNTATNMDIHEVFPVDASTYVASGMKGGTTSTGADQVRVWDVVSGSYKDYFLYRATIGTTTTRNYKWVEKNTPTVISTQRIKTGDAVWYVVYNPSVNLTFAGQVPVADDVNGKITLQQGYNMIGSGFATEWMLNTLSSTSFWSQAIFKGGTTSTGADQIRIWSPTTASYNDYFLYRATIGTSTTRNYKWVEKNTPVNVFTGTIPMNSGLWFIRYNAGSAELQPPVPYTL